MRIKTLIALLLCLLVIASFAFTKHAAYAQEATQETSAEEHAEEAAAESEDDHAEEGAAESAAEGEADHSEEAAETAEDDTPPGSALLMLLLGIGTVALVGGLNMMRRGGTNTPPSTQG